MDKYKNPDEILLKPYFEDSILGKVIKRQWILSEYEIDDGIYLIVGGYEPISGDEGIPSEGQLELGFQARIIMVNNDNIKLIGSTDDFLVEEEKGFVGLNEHVHYWLMRNYVGNIIATTGFKDFQNQICTRKSYNLKDFLQYPIIAKVLREQNIGCTSAHE